MHILLSNDDGIDAPGLAALRDAVAPLARLTVVAPQGQRSAAALSIKVRKPCLLTRRESPAEGIEMYSLDATPADCVKFALSSLLPKDQPDLVISGINRGQNTGSNVNYSGTVGAALEAAIYGLPSIAVSLAVEWDQPLDFGVAARFARHMAPQVIAAELPRGSLININVPNLPQDKMAGVAWCKQGHARFTDHWQALPEDNPEGVSTEDTKVVRNMGEVFQVSDDEKNDDNLLHRGFITVTPLSFDMTHHTLYQNPPAFDLTLG